MSDPYVGEIRIFAGNFAPWGWAFCDGSLLSIAENVELFTLIGTTYGGDGVNNFALPNLAGRHPVHPNGSTYITGMQAGVETVTLTTAQMASHSHLVRFANPATRTAPGTALWAQQAANAYSSQTPDTAMGVASITSTGGNQAHENMPPFVTVSYIIATSGVFPSQD